MTDREEILRRLDHIRRVSSSIPSRPPGRPVMASTPPPPIYPEPPGPRHRRAEVPGKCHGNYCPICDGDEGGTKVPAIPYSPQPSPLSARATKTLPLPAAVETLRRNLQEAEEAVAVLRAMIADLS